VRPRRVFSELIETAFEPSAFEARFAQRRFGAGRPVTHQIIARDASAERIGANLKQQGKEQGQLRAYP
jgi:hypothetical protein